MNDKTRDWIIILRHHLANKIDSLIKNRIHVVDKRTFIYTNTFCIEYRDNNYNFEVRLNQREIYFYDSEYHEDPLLYENSYYSMLDIYNALNSLKTLRRKKMIDLLKKGLSKKVIIKYEGQKFEHITFNFDEISSEYCLDINDKKISVFKLLLLLSLIQAKSNSFFDKTPDYKNGLLHLLIALLTKKEHPVLTSKGWYYNKNQNCFHLKKYTIALYVEINDRNMSDVLTLRKDIKSLTVKSAIEKFIEFYNSQTNSTYTIDSIRESEVQNSIKRTINANTKLLTVLNREKNGLSDFDLDDIDESDDTTDYKSIINLKCKQIYGKKYVWITLQTSKYEYYLTKREMEDIINLGI